jgi:hypothetical protein
MIPLARPAIFIQALNFNQSDRRLDGIGRKNGESWWSGVALLGIGGKLGSFQFWSRQECGDWTPLWILGSLAG